MMPKLFIKTRNHQLSTPASWEATVGTTCGTPSLASIKGRVTFGGLVPMGTLGGLNGIFDDRNKMVFYMIRCNYLFKQNEVLHRQNER